METELLARVWLVRKTGYYINIYIEELNITLKGSMAFLKTKD